MDSIVSEDVVQRGRLLVRIAENGHSIELDCDECTLVEAIQRFLEPVSGIQINDQLLLCLEMKLETLKPLSSYKLPSDDHEVFLFNKSRMRSNSIPPSPELIEIAEIPEPSPPSSSSSNPHPLDDASDPALKALPSYERIFRYHYQRGHSIYSRTQLKLENCERLLLEQKVQDRALKIARGILDHFYRMILQNYMDFMKCYTHQNRSHSSLLMNFGRDIDKLRTCRLHPSLITPTRKCLLDFVKEGNLRKVVDDCSGSHKQFENKVSEFKQDFGELKQSAEQLFASKASYLIVDLENAIKEHYPYIHEQKSIMQSLSKDVNMVKKLIDDCLSNQLSPSLRPHDAVSALGPIYDGHDSICLPKMEACDSAVSRLLDFSKDKKNEMNHFVHNYMQKMAYVQYTIKDIRYKFSVFTEAMKRQSEQFEFLRIVRGIGPAYRACFAEIVRRKASMKLYMGMAGQLAEKLATNRETEVRRREEFLKVHNSYIPRDILSTMGLYDTPNQCHVDIAPFDCNLLDIDITDLDRYAPEHLVSAKVSLSRSNDSVYSAGGEENAADAAGEGSELFEIAGTSKLEVENAKLKADLASALARICTLSLEVEIELLDDSNIESALKKATDKTTDALQLKDEYEKQLHSLLKDKQIQCDSYEKRIRELELKLSDHYSPPASSSKPELSGESMDEGSSVTDPLHAKVGLYTKPTGLDENMTDSSSSLNPHLDTSMMETPPPPSPHNNDDDGKNVAASDALQKQGSDSKAVGDLVVELQDAIKEKSNQLSETEIKLKDVTEEVDKLEKELDLSRKLLDESQMNCAHLENCLHEAREEAQTHLCAADRRAAEYSALRASAVKMRSLFERLRTCISSGGIASFSESLRTLAQSLANSTTGDVEDEGASEFRECIRVLADKVGVLSRHRAELIERYSKAEAANEQLKKELEEKKELVNTLYRKHQLEKQASKEKISFGRLEVHEIAAFVLNSASGHYEAIHRSCPNYYLSAESVALFTNHLPNQPSYIIGQIVHIERQTVKTAATTGGSPPPPEGGGGGNGRLNLNMSSNPYDLPLGCEYFIVTVAMLPDTSIHSSPSS
ncbi:autophagy-related protein 11 [Impatiens glandulifera]|uniref:autophagy-related protein 11 n=1 Tax=Impatiens glandulifera TaxID=253017 RepID=UPI001FB0AAEC|nr:autophagy-related protein 11 [Impatiens glandulifera]